MVPEAVADYGQSLLHVALVGVCVTVWLFMYV